MDSRATRRQAREKLSAWLSRPCPSQKSQPAWAAAPHSGQTVREALELHSALCKLLIMWSAAQQ